MTLPPSSATHRARPTRAPVAFESHGYPEKEIDLGEISMNYAEAGEPGRPAVLLIPGQSESWWGFEAAMRLLETDHHVFAVDLRGQGRSTWTPGRYSFDILGNDLVRFIDLAVGEPVVVSGNSSGAVLSAWLAAFAMPGQIRGAHLEDPPLFSGELDPLYGPSQRQSSGPVLELFARYLGDQWTIGDWTAFIAAAKASNAPLARMMGELDDVPQAFREYDPEWSRAFLDGTMFATSPSEVILAQIKAPIMLTHHARSIDPDTGSLVGALSDLQARKIADIVTKTGVRFEYRSFPDAMHAMHNADPDLFVTTFAEWMSRLPDPE